ncbi:hypothetical protein EYS14_07915 [Alteromonadaceae bacterium M269]|nr:hypothetical protein EYS14_07915 [Alteromonadaceae bacterium M269]
MIKLNLTTELTPESLQNLNADIEAALNSDEIDDKRVLQLIVERDALIQKLIEEWSDESSLKAFAEQEIASNTLLLEHTQALRKEVENSLGKLVRGRKAIKQYHG